VCDAAGVERAHQRVHDGVLTDDVGERLRAVFAREDLVRHAREVAPMALAIKSRVA
jgi:hypothetical protein